MINNEERIKSMPTKKYKEIFGIEKNAFDRILDLSRNIKRPNMPTEVRIYGKIVDG